VPTLLARRAYSVRLSEAVRRVVSAMEDAGLGPVVTIETRGGVVRMRSAGERRVGPMRLWSTEVEVEGGEALSELVRRSLMLGGG